MANANASKSVEVMVAKGEIRRTTTCSERTSVDILQLIGAREVARLGSHGFPLSVATTSRRKKSLKVLLLSDGRCFAYANGSLLWEGHFIAENARGDAMIGTVLGEGEGPPSDEQNLVREAVLEHIKTNVFRLGDRIVAYGCPFSTKGTVHAV